jgi:hypothetical protein
LGTFAIANYATGQSTKKVQQWEYVILKHSPHLKETRTDFKEVQAMGKEGWQLASSYTIRGEVVVSIFKRPR